MYILLKVIKELGRGLFQEANEFMCGWDLDPSMIFESEVELIMEDPAMFLPSRAISH